MERDQLARILGAGRSAPGCTRIEDPDPERFMEAFRGAVAGKAEVFLHNPSWGQSERSQALALEGRDVAPERGWLMIPSGGSSGKLKFARHDAHTISAAVEGFRRHFNFERVNSVGVLPLNHVSGLMAWMRSAVSGGRYLPWSWKELQEGRFPETDKSGWCLSLVPTQLQRLLGSADAVRWMRSFSVIFVGGAPSWGGLLDAAAKQGLRISLGYGSTETLAMACALHPDAFLAGARSCGAAMPHARVDLVDSRIRVSGPSIFRGYYPQFDDSSSWVSGDVGALAPDGALSVLGRADDVIITGGEKVFPEEVEAALMASGRFADVVVVGLPDATWGSVVVACYPRSQGAAPEGLEEALRPLAAFKRPKRFVAVDPWPRTAQGKLSRPELVRRLLA